MRWLYYDPLQVEEVEYRTVATARFHSFWEAFGQKVSVLESALTGGTAWDWQRWLSELLADVDRRFHWEIVPDDRPENWRMVISAQTHRAARPLLRDFLAAAPQVPHWTFHQWLPALGYPLARRWARQRSGGDCDHLAVKVRSGNARTLDLVFTPLPDAPPGSPQSWLTVAFTASEAILGEEMFDRFVGSVSMAPPTEAKSWWHRLRKPAGHNDAVGMSELSTLFASHLSQQRNDLPAAPLARLIDSRGWTTLELDRAEHAGQRRREDIRLMTTSVVALPILTAAHDGNRFSSALHSRFEETFCYLQWQHDASSDRDLLAHREELELAIAKGLGEQSTACVIGGGIGERYLYFDLAVTDLKQAIPALRKALLPHKPPQCCWLLFYDDEFAEEWIGIHPDAVAPPGLQTP